MKLFKLIIPDDLDLYQRSVIQTTNLISLFIGVSLIIVALYNVLSGEFINAGVVLSVALITIINLLITKKGYTLFPKILCIYFPAIIVFVNLLAQGRVPEGQVIAIIPATILAAFFLGTLIDRKESPFFYYFSASFLFAFSLTYDLIIFSVSEEVKSILFVRDIYSFFKVPHILVIIIIIITSSFFKDLLNAYRIKSELLMSAIQSKNRKLSQLNFELEEKVQQRTKELVASREKIAKVAFLSSHKIRGPISTILGLTALLRDHPDEQELLLYIPKLYDEAKKMDHALFNMNDDIKDELELQSV